MAAATRMAAGTLSRHRTGELALLATRGMAAVEPYLTRYLPALVVASVLPLATLAAITWLDWLSGLIVLGHASAGAGVRDPHRGVDPRPRRPAVAAACCTVGSLPRRRPRPAHPGRAPAGPCPGRVHPGDHRPLPPGHRGHPEAGVRLLGCPRAHRHPVGRAGRGQCRAPARLRVARLPHRADRSAARTRRPTGRCAESARSTTPPPRAPRASRPPTASSTWSVRGSAGPSTRRGRPAASPSKNVTVGYGERTVLEAQTAYAASPPASRPSSGPPVAESRPCWPRFSVRCFRPPGRSGSAALDLADHGPGQLAAPGRLGTPAAVAHSGTIADNIRIGRPEATDAEVWQALERVVPRPDRGRPADGAGHPARRGRRRPLRGPARKGRAGPGAGLAAPLRLPRRAHSAPGRRDRGGVPRHPALALGHTTVVVVAHRQAVVDAADQVLHLPGPPPSPEAEAEATDRATPRPVPPPRRLAPRSAPARAASVAVPASSWAPCRSPPGWR